jgi:hypothetical protein
MHRITEPELMTDKAQAEAFAAANFEQPFQKFLSALKTQVKVL